MTPEAFLQIAYQDLSREPPPPLPDLLHDHHH